MFYLLSIFFLVFAYLFLFAPSWLIRLSEWGNRLILTDHNAVLHRKFTGILLLCLGVAMFLVGLKYQ